MTSAGVILTGPAFVRELEAAAEQAGKTPEQAQRYAKKCLREIEANPQEAWVRPMARMARFIYTRSYERELDINLDAVEKLRELSTDHLLLFLWSHKSHMDSFVFLLSLYEHNFRPTPLIFAGLNMNFLGFGALARRVGAIFLRRSFNDDPIYKLVFRRYIDFLIANQTPLSWSIEGTRSRTGNLSPPKLGILSWVLESCYSQRARKVLLVPVAIAFDQIAEIDDYVAIQSGKPKQKESLRWFFDYVFGRERASGKIYLRYGEPLPLDNGEDWQPVDGEPVEALQRQQVFDTAFEICRRIEQITPIKSADVLSMVLLGANQRALSAREIHAQAAEIVQLIEQRQLPTGTGFSLQTPEEVEAAVLVMMQSGLVKSFKAAVPVYYIPGNKQLAAAYYRNTITHYFLAAALGEIALAMCAEDSQPPGQTVLRDRVMALRDLYKFEFFFQLTDAFWDEVIQSVSSRYPGWDSATCQVQLLLSATPPLFGHAILRSITEAYLLIAMTLLERGAEPVVNDKDLTRQLLTQGKQMLLRRRISCESSLSQDLFTTGLRLAEHRHLLAGEADTLLPARRTSAEFVVATLAAINLLQRSYDTAWFSALPVVAAPEAAKLNFTEGRVSSAPPPE